MLKALDIQLFYLLHHFQFPGLDAFSLFINSPNSTIVAALGSILWLVLRPSKKTAVVFVCLWVMVGITDYVAFNWLKEYFARLRPCYEIPGIRIPQVCGAKYGFPSNHAMNTMAIAVLLFLQYPKAPRWIFLAVALIVGVSRVHLGTHYVSDVLAGFVMGGIMALPFHFLARDVVVYLSTPRPVGTEN